MGGVLSCSPCSFGAFELAIIGNGYILCSTGYGLAIKCDFETLDRINRKSGQNWKSICFLTVFKHKFCTLNACQYNYRLQFVMKFAYNTF